MSMLFDIKLAKMDYNETSSNNFKTDLIIFPIKEEELINWKSDGKEGKLIATSLLLKKFVSQEDIASQFRHKAWMTWIFFL